MRVLHLLSEYRWTGLAEPVVNLVAAMRSRGARVLLACRPAPTEASLPPRRVVAERARLLDVDPVLSFGLNRHRPLLHTLKDLVRLPPFLKRHHIQIVHTHLSHDHLVGGLAARLAGTPIVVRTSHKGAALNPGTASKIFYRTIIDAYIGFSRLAAPRDATTFGLPRTRAFTINPSVDLARFRPDGPFGDIRAKLGVPPQAVLAALVARVQPHRRFDLLFEALRAARQRVPDLHLVIIGAGTDAQRVVREPLAGLGLAQAVHVAGYRDTDYVDFLAACDFNLLLVPGSDGTCRAAREAMAMGKPVVAARRGMLPELIQHGQTGLLIDLHGASLTEAMVKLASDAPLRARMGQAARKHALATFNLLDQADEVLAIYRTLLSAAG